MTVANASIEARVSYQLFQSSSMSSRAFRSRGNLAGRDGGWRGSAGAEAPSKPVTKYLSNGATNPIHARYYCGGNICLKCALKHTRRQRPRPCTARQDGAVWCGINPPNAQRHQAEYDRRGIGVDLACRGGIFRGWRQLSDAIAAPSTNALKQSSWYRIRVTRSARSAGLR